MVEHVLGDEVARTVPIGGQADHRDHSAGLEDSAQGWNIGHGGTSQDGRVCAQPCLNSRIDCASLPSLRTSARVTDRVPPNVGMKAECLPAPPITSTMR